MRPRPRSAASLVFICGFAGCGSGVLPFLPDDEFISPIDADRYELLVRLAHISDAHVVDEESPARLTFLGELIPSAWRPQEVYSTQILDGTIRTVNKIHVAQKPIDFLIHTGDGCDNAQGNELAWFIRALDGGEINPLSGVDDRNPAEVPPAHLDPHAPFVAQGLYRHGVHGGAATIPWYNVAGNHEGFALGVLPIVADADGVLVSPLPGEDRAGIFAPAYLDPTGQLSWILISPANPGPSGQLLFPRVVMPNPQRRFFTDEAFVQAHLASAGEPHGHGFSPAALDRTWYSVSPEPGLRLIVLNSSTPRREIPTLAYADGAISAQQRDFLAAELAGACANDEAVVVATHHPSGFLEPLLGSSFTPQSFRDLLNLYPCVKLHIAGHWHRHAVLDRGGYLEIVTGSLIDSPQQGRIIELWRLKGAETPQDGTEPSGPSQNDHEKIAGLYACGAEDAEIAVRFFFFAHYDVIDPPDDSHADLFADPLAEMRRVAAVQAGITLPDANQTALRGNAD